MYLVVVSSKRCWRNDAGKPVTTGGFPLQVRAISELFDRTHLLLSVEPGPPPANAIEVETDQLRVEPLSPLLGEGWRRKLRLLPWLWRHNGRLRRAIAEADAVHAPVPGDLGSIAMILAWRLEKRLFVRHCGTWGDTGTPANRLLALLLPRLAGGRIVVMATGGGPRPPAGNRPVEWIFASALGSSTLEAIEPAVAWQPGVPPRLVSVGRLTRRKNVGAILEAMPAILRAHPEAGLQIIGDGPERAALETRTRDLGLSHRVDFAGQLALPQVLEALCASHLFLFPTRVAEGFPKALLEAMACGLPSAGSRVSVIPHLLASDETSGECGIVLGAPTAREVSQAVLSLLEDPGRMRSMGLRARERAREYTLERWQSLIRARLEAAWRRSLKDSR